jgi:hypothetical protein
MKVNSNGLLEIYGDRCDKDRCRLSQLGHNLLPPSISLPLSLSVSLSLSVFDKKAKVSYFLEIDNPMEIFAKILQL